MRRLLATAALLAGLAGGWRAAVPAAVATPVAGSPETGAWEASDRLDPYPDAPAPAGTRLRVGALTYETAPDVWASTIRANWEPAAGPGAGIGWCRYWLSGSEAADRLDLHLAFREPGFRLVAGVRMERMDGAHALRLLLRGDREWAPGLSAGLRLGLDPAAADGGADAAVLVSAARGAWMAGLELGGGTGLRRLATGLRLGGGLVWTAALTGTDPTTGLALRIRNSELRVEETRHALLGRVTIVRWVLGGFRP